MVTKDEFVLGLHRIPRGKTGRDGKKRPVVLLWHGFLMCSEVFVCRPDPGECLPFVLADLGYDVWLANSRGNKYSCKHLKHSPGHSAFWDFSMDEIAIYDIPAVIDVRLF